MNNLFAILAILGAVVLLGVFRVPDEDALVSAGIKAEARAALYQQRHPLAVEVDRRRVTVSGRVESEADRQSVLARVAALDGVEDVRDRLTVLPSVAPFQARISRDAQGVRFDGHVPEAAVGQVLVDRLGLEQLPPVATGAPDRGWGQAVLLGASALERMLDGDLRVVDRGISLVGSVHLPDDLKAIDRVLSSLPEGYDAALDIAVVDDGLPYSLLVSRDPRMGLRASGKLPPETDQGLFEALGPAQHMDLREAPLPLTSSGFDEVMPKALAVFDTMDAGVLTIADRVIVLDGGPDSAALQASLQSLQSALPEGWVLHAHIVPQDDGEPVRLEVVWDGSKALVSGRVPADFVLSDLSGALDWSLGAAGLERGPFPDLSGWAAGAMPGLRALKLLEGGALRYGADGMMVEGTAANPLARDRAAAAMGDNGDLNVVLTDDGTPPHFTLTYDPARGARVTGKVPRDLTPDRLAQALGLDTGRGTVPVSPDPALGDLVLEALTSLRAWLPDIETIDIVHSPAGVGLTIAATPGVPVDRFETVLRRTLPFGADLKVTAAEPPATGTRRQHVVLQQPQVFSAGLWLPDLAVAADADGCAAGAEAVPQLAFERGGLDLAIGSGRSYAALVALIRACTRIAGLRAEVQVGTQETGIEALDRQLSRRRAENMVDRLVAHGVPKALISGSVLSGHDGIRLRFVQD